MLNLLAHQGFLSKHQTHVKVNLKCATQGENGEGGTVDIFENVLWEPVTKTVHPKRNEEQAFAATRESIGLGQRKPFHETGSN